MVSGGLLLKEKYEFSFFSTELPHYCITTLASEIKKLCLRGWGAVGGGGFFCWFLDIKDRSS